MHTYHAEDEITVGHRTFSEHLWHLSEQKLICSAKLSERRMRTRGTHTRNRNAMRSLGVRFARGYTASKCKCPSQYATMKRSLTASASE